MIRRHLPFLLLFAAACGKGPEADAPMRALPAGTVEYTPAQMAQAKLGFDTVRIASTTIPIALPGTLDTPDPETAHVGSIVSGRIDQVMVLPGDRVRAGQPLVKIHSHELATARRDLESAEAASSAAKAALDRSTRLLAAGAVAREEVEQRNAVYRAAEGERQRAAELVSHLRPDGDEVVIVAPRAGVVFTVEAKLGEAVLEGASLVELGDDAALWVTAWVPEASLGLISAAKQVRVTLAAFPGDTLPGRVVRTGGRLDAARRAVDIRVVLERRPAGLRPGMFALVHVAGGQRVERAILPAEAVQRVGDGAEVYVVDAPNRFRRFPVTDAVLLEDGRVAVLGLKPGMVVVGRGAYFVRSSLDAEAPE
ncbi:efflux RND transporter periplasmic adaptor subunit [Thauera sp.]|uniref:efflux RND transporter periplasmic adaptor subunit n=1 Tax=Thauera sp. TaxID=1905334 RepID=UPI001B55E588|nr:efflux RND transporter periplasmic adaptor subunit [Thauera sp.]MBK6494828.1 efflux RND transporter periplasmic adaptor subunit [Gemmatimonadota bacterium]MBP6133383.1 efflux RND transporter periplasmic adaptor subunit [Thauera sp.]